MSITFVSHNIAFTLKKKNASKRLILAVIKKEKRNAGDIIFNFCNDKFLLALNKKFLNHNTITDIITFQYPGKALSAELFISIPRVKENAKKFKVSFDAELHRIMIHGVLHLCGYTDKTSAKKKEMTKRENYYLTFK